MNVESLRSQPLGTVGVVLITVLYSVERLVTSLFAISYAVPEGRTAVWAGFAGFAIAYLLWRGFLVGWVAAVVLYTLLVLDLALGATVFGFTQVPQIVVAFAALAYLLSARNRFQTISSSASSSTE